MSTKIIKGGTLIDGTGKPPVKGAVVVIEDNKIASVGKMAEEAIPKGDNVEIIDAGDKTVMPGLIDSHVHIYTDGETSEFTYMPINYNNMDLAMRCIPRLKRTLMMGITSLRDGGSGWGWLEVALRDAISRGEIIGPRFFCTGRQHCRAPGRGDAIS